MTLSMRSLKALRESRHSVRAVFIDDGGVLNDNRVRGCEYRALIGEFMSARFGGSAQQWAEANGRTFSPLWADLQSRITDFTTHEAYQREYELLWIHRMCCSMGVPTPPDDMAMTTAREAHLYAGRHARTEVDGATACIWKIFHAGYSLYTASGTPSWELREILGRMGVYAAFSDVYGPDLVDHVKYGVAFYDRIFAKAGLSPRECLVIESSQESCLWAMEAGATAVWVDCDDVEAIAFSEVVEALT